MAKNTNQLSKELIKKLNEDAKKLNRDLEKIISEELLKTYKENVLASYDPRSSYGAEVTKYNKAARKAELEDAKQGLNTRHRRKKQTYTHSGIFYDSIEVQVKDGKIYIVHDLSDKYTNGKTVKDVYKYLTEGTEGGHPYFYMDSSRHSDGEIKQGANYSTPVHLFEQHTMNHMMGFLRNLDLRKYVGTRRYYKKWR